MSATGGRQAPGRKWRGKSGGKSSVPGKPKAPLTSVAQGRQGEP